MVNFNEKELVIFDLDGTLAPSKRPMDPQMAGLFCRLVAVKKVAVTSGGGYPQFQTQFLGSLPHDVVGLSNLILLPTSGTRMYTWQGDWVEKYREDLSKQEKETILAAITVSLKASGYIEPARAYGQIIEDRGSQITFSGLGQEAPLEAKLAWDPRQEKRLAIVTVIKEKLPGFDVRVGGTTSIDVTRRGINKAYGIRKLEDLLGLPTEKIVFVGDALFYGGNDYPAKTTGVDCIQVSGPEETKKLVQGWLS